MFNPFSKIVVSVAPELYDLNHYEKELTEIARIFKKELAALPKEIPGEGDSEPNIPTDDVEEITPRKRLAGQRSQAMSAASKRLSRGVALRFILDCKRKGFPITVHLASLLLEDLFFDFGRSGISGSVLVRFAGGGLEAQRNKKLNLGQARVEILKSGTLEKHRDLLGKTKDEAATIRRKVAGR